MAAVTEAVVELTPKAKPSPYAKRWWTTDLTQLRRTYTYWRNQARSRRRAGRTIPELEQRAREAAKEYHDAIRKQKKAHWEDFLADDTNIWQATKYLKPSSSSFSDKIPPLTKLDGSTTKDKTEQAEELLAHSSHLYQQRLKTREPSRKGHQYTCRSSPWRRSNGRSLKPSHGKHLERMAFQQWCGGSSGQWLKKECSLSFRHHFEIVISLPNGEMLRLYRLRSRKR